MMAEIKLYNTATRSKQVFAPIDPQNVRMYVCGPTVYDRAHLGNARPVVTFDVLYRLLRHVYGAAHVTYVRNITDVDDKINARAGESGRDIAEITTETAQWYLEDMGELGALEPDAMPRATDFVPRMVAMIKTLIARGHAYEAEGHVLFRVRSCADYGALSGRSVDDMIAGARVEVAPYKEDPMDFVLWKPSAPALPGWDSPWGRGRPGWHIECSAMSHALLGESFDIHGGGADLMFPHHENERAQSRCAHPDGDFARVWMHNEMLRVEGQKMSKSLGNFFTVRDLLDRDVSGEVIRFVFLQTHYRKPMDWTDEKAEQARAFLRAVWGLVGDAVATEPSAKVLAALADDLNTPLAITELHGMAAAVRAGKGDAGELLATMKLLGHFTSEPTAIAFGGGHSDEQHKAADALAHQWMAFRQAGNFEAADRLRARAAEEGVELRVVKEGGAQLAKVVFSGRASPDRLKRLGTDSAGWPVAPAPAPVKSEETG